ncbi:MAG: hypothetical protein KC912_06825 [Proteobacteria bacterium]|nr:hypothetical protein [Pseudomonadota bacterium]
MRHITIAAVLFMAACGGKGPANYSAVESAATSGGKAEAKLAEADALWAERGDADKLLSALTAYEEAVALDPSNRGAYEHLVRGWYFYGDSHTDDVDTKVERWGTAIEWGAKCMALNDDFRGQIEAGEKEKDAVLSATADDVPCLYWLASALGKWGKAQSLSKTLKHLPTVKAYITKVEELDPTYNNYGPARYWGVYYSALPSFAGRDFEKSAEYFEASIQGAPGYLGTRVLRAEYLAVGTGDEAMFDADLAAVLAADPNTVEGFEPENGKEIEKAKAIQAKKSELF